MGFWFSEKIRFDPISGRCLTNGTWDYLPPMSKDIPADFRISFIENSKNPVTLLGAKCIGEPPVCLSVSAWIACKIAIEEARKEFGNNDIFNLSSPVTPEILQLTCLSNYQNFSL